MGLYVVMFLQILKTMIQVILVFSVLIVAFGLTFDCDLTLPPAALPPTPIDDDVPDGPVDVPAVPSVEAEVPPAAALPPLPTVAEEPDGEVEAPPVAAPLALCATAYVDSVQNAAIIKVFREVSMGVSYFLSEWM